MRYAELYRIEAELRGLDPEARLAGRQEHSTPLIADMQAWHVHHRARVAAKSPLGEALAYIAKYWDGLKLFLTDGRIEIDNNSVERTIRPIATLGKSYMGESLKSSNRIHAIQFGQFYLRAFGSRLTPAEVIDAFQHWSIDRDTSFSALTSAEIDPQVLAVVGQIVAGLAAKKDEKG